MWLLIADKKLGLAFTRASGLIGGPPMYCVRSSKKSLDILLQSKSAAAILKMLLSAQKKLAPVWRPQDLPPLKGYSGNVASKAAVAREVSRKTSLPIARTGMRRYVIPRARRASRGGMRGTVQTVKGIRLKRRTRVSFWPKGDSGYWRSWSWENEGGVSKRDERAWRWLRSGIDTYAIEDYGGCHGVLSIRREAVGYAREQEGEECRVMLVMANERRTTLTFRCFPSKNRLRAAGVTKSHKPRKPPFRT